MGIGAGVFLLAVGAVLAFAVHYTVSGINIQTIGVILMIAGVIGILLDLAIFMPRRRRTVAYDDGYAGGAAPTRRAVTDERL